MSDMRPNTKRLLTHHNWPTGLRHVPTWKLKSLSASLKILSHQPYLAIQMLWFAGSISLHRLGAHREPRWSYWCALRITWRVENGQAANPLRTSGRNNLAKCKRIETESIRISCASPQASYLMFGNQRVITHLHSNIIQHTGKIHLFTCTGVYTQTFTASGQRSQIPSIMGIIIQEYPWYIMGIIIIIHIITGIIYNIMGIYNGDYQEYCWFPIIQCI